MKEVLFIIFISITTSNYSQIQKIFYVDDAKTIDYVTVRFCVNDSARIDKVTVVPEQTTYKNEHVTEQLAEYLKTIQYYEDSKLRNNCYPSTFEFVNKKYEKAELTESESVKCKKFKKGKFKYLDIRYMDTKIKRTRKKQYEESDDFKAKYKVVWTSDCEYEMTYVKVREKENRDLLGETIKVKIIDVLEDSYIYLADILDKPTVISEMQLLK